MFKNIQAYFKTFGFIIPIIFLFIFYSIKINHTLILLLFYFFNLIYFIWLVSILYLTYLILKKSHKITTIKYISLIKDWEFIKFKNKLFQLYYSIIIILFIYLFKFNLFYFILDLNINYINFLLIIFLIFSILLSKTFIIFLFNFYLKIKYIINSLSEINFIYYKKNKIKIKSLIFNPGFNSHLKRSFSTSILNKNNNDPDPEQKVYLFGTEPKLTAEKKNILSMKRLRTLKSLKNYMVGDIWVIAIFIILVIYLNLLIIPIKSILIF